MVHDLRRKTGCATSASTKWRRNLPPIECDAQMVYDIVRDFIHAYSGEEATAPETEYQRLITAESVAAETIEIRRAGHRQDRRGEQHAGRTRRRVLRQPRRQRRHSSHAPKCSASALKSPPSSTNDPYEAKSGSQMALAGRNAPEYRSAAGSRTASKYTRTSSKEAISHVHHLRFQIWRPPAGEATIRAMFLNNPHGAGYMVARGRRVQIHKGFMRLDEIPARHPHGTLHPAGQRGVSLSNQHAGGRRP